MRRRRRRLGLRARITFIFALGALLLSSMVAVGTFTLARARLLSETEDSARSTAFGNAIDLRARLRSVPDEQLDPDETVGGDAVAAEEDSAPATSPSVGSSDNETTDPETTDQTEIENKPVVDIDEVRADLAGDQPPRIEAPEADNLDPDFASAQASPAATDAEPIDAITSILEDLRPNSAESLLVFSERDRSLTGLRRVDIPADLRALVEAGTVAEQVSMINGDSTFVVGVPITGLDASYYEASSLIDLEDTLSSLQVILGGTALAASLAGAALGWYSARRALQPLTDVSVAAASIAVGEFETRLDAGRDPDLASLTSSFNDMVDALQARTERDARFASDVSHELRSPLMTLSASVGVLEGRKHEMPLPAQQAVDLLTHDVRRFERLVGDLLEISRIDSGAVELERSPVFLYEFLRFVVAQSRVPEVPIDVRPQDTNLVLSADKRRLAQAVTNLVDNAAKYAGTPSCVGFRHEGNRVEIFVDDLGPGVPVEDRDRIFDRFARAGSDAGRRDVATGVGLGLSLVSEHVRLHGGTVKVTDRPDGRAGARFVIDLPIGERLDFDEEMAT